MKRKVWNSIYRMAAALSMACLVLLLSACGEQRELHNMGAGIVDDKWAVLWEGRCIPRFVFRSFGRKG